MKNMSKTKVQTLKGFRDFLPEKMAIRNEVIKRLKTVFEKYGYEELQTPVLEYQDLLLGKYGEQAEKLMYLFKDPGDRPVGLRYDLTVPLARVSANNPNLVKPFKRYQIQPVYRAEKPQKGRYREVYQCDIDIIGSSSPLADAEILAIIYESLKALGFKNFDIRINSRPILFAIMEAGEVEEEKWLSVLQSLDKLDKLSEKEVRKELLEKKGLEQPVMDQLFSILKTMQESGLIKNKLLTGNVSEIPFKELQEPINKLKAVIFYATKLGVNKNNIVIDLTLSRGLDYYTGAIFETVIYEPKIGSITGGGRYDKLLKTLGGPDLPATGTTIGLDRVCDVIEENNLWQDFDRSSVKVLVTILAPNLLDNSIETANLLRQNQINTDVYPDMATSLDKQLKYANKKGIPYVVIIGPDEIKKNKVTLKNMKTGKQEVLEINEVIKKLKNGD
jgi:histidyl-tRNA synthetase